MPAVSVLMVAVSRCSSLYISQAQINQSEEKDLKDLAYQTAQNGGGYVQPIELTAVLLILELHAHGHAQGKQNRACKTA